MSRLLYLFHKPNSTILLLAFLAMGFTIYTDVIQSSQKGLSNPNDFATLYAGAICASSDCNPYRVEDLDAALRERRGEAVLQDWTDQLPIYPPTTILLLKPFASLSYRSATLTWYSLSLATFVCGVLWAFLFSPFLRSDPLLLRLIAVVLALHFPKMIQCLGFGNPSLIVIGLLLFAVFDHPTAKYIPRVICAALAVWLKVTVALPLMLLVVFTGHIRSRRCWISIGIFSVATAGLFLYTAHLAGMHRWTADLGRNLALGGQNGMSVFGHISPSNVLLNAANLPAYFTRNPRIISGFSLIAVSFLAMALFVSFTRLNSRVGVQSAYVAVVPALAIVSLLPVYHRFCDIGLMLFVVPWLIHRVTHNTAALDMAIAVVLGLLYFSWERRIHLERFHGTILRVVEFLYYRGDALLVLTLAVLLTIAIYRSVPGARAGFLAG